MIQRLASHIVNQIAAGEVVERPSSVVKELVENSIDANASKISVSYEQGGLKRIIIDDDGKGLASEEIHLAFEPHATSKLSEIEDLTKLSTFGFRGEALPSIASVSEIEIWSSTQESSSGAASKIQFGERSPVTPADRRVGTRIEVRNLFHQQPARLKFMKSIRAESQAILQTWKRYALAYPEIIWSVKDLETSKNIQLPKQSALERVLWFFDSEENDREWFEISRASPTWNIKIFICKPSAVGKFKSGIHLYLNRRPIRDSKLEYAVRRAYEGFTENPRELSAVVFLDGSAEHFDVNVHPMKLEVRFTNPEHLFSEIVHAIRVELEGTHRSSVERLPSPPLMASVPPISAQSFERVNFGSSRVNLPSPTEIVETAPIPQAFLFSEVQSYEYLASLDDTYLVVKKSKDLYLFDQHALHERILYEKFLAQYEKGEKFDSQRLLFPVPIGLADVHVLLEQEALLEKLGFELRLWNDSKIQLIAAPSFLKRGYKEVLVSLIESLELPVETLSRQILATLACHSAVRAHDRISRPEINQLLKDFETKDSVGYCPHGRPTFIHFDRRELEKMFHRIL